jgi:hypothetical protein
VGPRRQWSVKRRKNGARRNGGDGQEPNHDLRAEGRFICSTPHTQRLYPGRKQQRILEPTLKGTGNSAWPAAATTRSPMRYAHCYVGLRPLFRDRERDVTAQLVVSDSKNTITLVRSLADVSPPYGFMLLPGTTSSGFAMKRSSFSLSHTKSAPFMALE